MQDCKRQRSTSNVSDMLHLNRSNLEDRRKYALLVMVYKIANENAAIPGKGQT